MRAAAKRNGTAMVLLAVCASAAHAKSIQYRNEEFGFTVQIPSEYKVCTALSGDHPHGFYYNLSTSIGCSRSPAKSRVSTISIYASYNVLNDSLVGSAPSGCRKYAFDGIPKQPGRLFAGNAYSCIVRNSDGSVNLNVVMQKRIKSSDADPDVNSINYLASLHSYPQNLRRDSAKFAEFLSSVK